MKKYSIVLLVLLAICLLAFTVLYQSAGANIDPEQHRVVLFLPVVLQQCRTGENCAIVEPTPQPVCDEEYFWMCE